MDNVIKFKPKTKPKAKAKETLPYETKYNELIAILRNNIDILGVYESAFVSFSMSPIYFKGNEKPENWKILFEVKRLALEDLLTDLDSDEFRSTINKSDFPKILHDHVSFTPDNIPMQITIPFAKCIFTLVMFYLNDKVGWIITEMYANNISVTQHCFEQLAKKQGTGVQEIFLGEDE